MRRALVAFTVMVVAAAVAAPPVTGDERVLRGVHQGRGGVAGLPEIVQGAERTVYRVQDRAVVETWLVRGMGHAWSGGDARGSHTYPPGPDATDAMLRFLVE
jgi:poly(3-hydroxybutyrate) depolymerase